MQTLKKITLAVALLLFSLNAFSQNLNTNQAQRDTLVRDTLDMIVGDTLQTISLEERLQCDTPIHQDQNTLYALQTFTLINSQTLKMVGYRVRIYFDNSKNARNHSQEIETDFKEKHPNIPTYRTYTNPFFKVTVGDFRTKSEAIKFMNSIKETYPSAFVIKEEIKFPLLAF